MTVRVTTLKGQGAGRYYTEHLPSYYLDGDEPPGRWWGKAAVRLGLHGEIGAEAFLALMAGQDHATGAELGRRYGEDSVRGYDATFSAPKSVSVLFALGDEIVRSEVVEAHERAVEAVLAWIQDHAHTRMRREGAVVCVDTEGIMAGVFRQHTSRRLDPQLHTHAVIANRVMSPDGRWLALDARTIKLDQRTLSALYHASLRAELTRRLGVAWRQPEHGIAEMAGIDDDTLAAFSQRTDDIARRLDLKVARFRRRMRRDPTDTELWSLEREAVLDSRPAKPHGVTATDLHAEWRQRANTLGRHPDRLVRQMVSRNRQPVSIRPDVAAVILDGALASLDGQQSTWRPAELLREIAAATPTATTTHAEHLTALLQELADQATQTRCIDVTQPALESVALRRDGRPITEAAVERKLTTRAILDQEHEILVWAERRQTRVQASGLIGGFSSLSPGQAAAVATVAGDRGLELIVGPAGAGKTTALAHATTRLAERGRGVFGVAPTAAAAEVLAGEAGMSADTIDKLLTEHNHPSRPPHPTYALPVGTTIVVDEAATLATPKLAALARLSDQHKWRVVMVGDPRQFSAVGRGGMFSHLVDTHGAIELDEVHRFAHDWERQATLQLRQGNPDVLTEYDQRGRLHGGTQHQMETGIIDAWHQARQRGEEVALMANNTDAVARLNILAQNARIAAGELDPARPLLQVGDQRIGIGDEIVTRRNHRGLRTDQGIIVKNRHRWTVTHIHPDCTITVTGLTGTARLPADYVAVAVELGYAQTSHATQGRTVDIALLLIDTPTDGHGIYTPMTRGRDANHAFVVVEDNMTPTDVLTQAIGREWADQPALARQERNRLPEGEEIEAEIDLDGRVRQAMARADARRSKFRSLDISR